MHRPFWVFLNSRAAQVRGESSIKNFVGDTSLSPRTLTDPKSYQAILKQQVRSFSIVGGSAETAWALLTLPTQLFS